MSAANALSENMNPDAWNSFIKEYGEVLGFTDKTGKYKAGGGTAAADFILSSYKNQ